MYLKWLFEIAWVSLREMFNSLDAGDGRKININYTALSIKCVLDSWEAELGTNSKS